MKNDIKRDEYLIEVSWEVCNLVGGIYTVLSTKAKTLHDIYDDKLIFIGPDIWNGVVNPYFSEDENLLSEWTKKAKDEGLKIRIGRWNIPGKPIVVLVDFDKYYKDKNILYGKMWEWYNVDSLHSYGDYDEASMFAYASALVCISLYDYFKPKQGKFLAHFNEWTTGLGLLYVKKERPKITTLFTTHATSIGRSIAGNNKPLYDYLNAYNGDQMASELNMESKHSVEKAAAQQADSFTTVSDITATEAKQLLEREAIVTPNGFEENFVPSGSSYISKRKKARQELLSVASKLIGYTPSQDAFLIATAGRYEYKNKGIDVFIDSIDMLRHLHPAKEVIAFILVPAWVSSPRMDLKSQLNSFSLQNHPLSDPLITHGLHNYNDDAVMNRLHQLHFHNNPNNKVKIIFVPSYLKGEDGIFNMTYYNLLIGMDVTVFPSYYEPWGYTPLESVAFGVPTITTDLSGFGKWCESEGWGDDISSGVKVIHRTDNNYDEVVKDVAYNIINLISKSKIDLQVINDKSRNIAHMAQWENFIKFYMLAFDKAIDQSEKRNSVN